MNLTWGRLARRDLREIVSYLAEDSLYAAELVATRILKTAGMLTEMPRIGRVGRVKGTRELLVLRTPYLLIYRISSRSVSILRVLHGARRWPMGRGR